MRIIAHIFWTLLFLGPFADAAPVCQKSPEIPQKPAVDAPKPAEQGPPDADLKRRIGKPSLTEDLEQFRSLLKTEWILSNLTDADFDAAIEAVAKDAPAGMTIADLALRLQRVLALGGDGHACVAELPAALQSISGVRPQFAVDLAGDRYVAFVVQRDPLAAVNPRIDHRFRPLKDGYPYLVAIDGRPMRDWIGAASQYVPKGPDDSVRWRSMRLLLELPVIRRDLGLPDGPRIRVRLSSEDRADEVELDAPAGPYQTWHFQVPKPDWRIIGGQIGYIWIPEASASVEAIGEAMPKLRDTKGLILDLRGNTGGYGLEALQLLASYLLPPDHPRKVVGRIVRWQDTPWPEGLGAIGAVSPDDGTLSKDGKQLVRDYCGPAGPWGPPAGRPTKARAVLLSRAEAEPNLVPYCLPKFPKTYPYSGPVVVLFDHRCFSAGELTLASLKELPNVILVGPAATAAGGGSPKSHRLTNSGLEVLLSATAFIRADGTPIDGRGIKPDVAAEPDADYYLGARDRMLEKAIRVLKGRIATNK